MATIQVYTESYGLVTIKDAMIDGDGTCLEEGVDILDESGDLLCELVGYSTDGLEDDSETVEYLIDTYNED